MGVDKLGKDGIILISEAIKCGGGISTNGRGDDVIPKAFQVNGFDFAVGYQSFSVLRFVEIQEAVDRTVVRHKLR